MPRTATKKAPTKAPTKAKKMEKLLADCERLANTTTLKHPKKPHEANFALFEAQAELRQLYPLWTQKEAGRVLFLKQRIQRGHCSDFPGMTQASGAAALNNLALAGLVFKTAQ